MLWVEMANIKLNSRTPAKKKKTQNPPFPQKRKKIQTATKKFKTV